MKAPFNLHLGDCMERMRELPANSVDSIVCDPPYGYRFMGKKWDYDVPSTAAWAECLRVLKPGGYLLAFAGTRTQHRMAVRIEDAGFEIRDMLAWLHGQGFPKSHNGDWGGTALKPAMETVTFASKPFQFSEELGRIIENLIELESLLWSLSSANAAAANLVSSQAVQKEGFGIAQWSAEKITSTRAALCAQMGTSQFELAMNTSLSIVCSWRQALAGSWSVGSTSTIETKLNTTIDWSTLKYSLSQITPESITRACSLPGGFPVNASIAEKYFNASLLLLQSILTLSATESAMWLAQQKHQEEAVKPNLDPCIMARKSPDGTIAENYGKYGTGGLNIEQCRVGGEAGRWAANVLHDGSDGVLANFPDAPGQLVAANTSSKPRNGQNVYGAMARGRGTEDSADSENAGAVGFKMKPGMRRDDVGSAARFFYCAKASRQDRNEGLPSFAAPAVRAGATMGDRERADWEARNGNHHATVKPTELMRYLCRLVTPAGGVVLDPFMGSGSTGKAAMLEGFKFIGMEREPEYLEISRARILWAWTQRLHATRQPSLFAEA